MEFEQKTSPQAGLVVAGASNPVSAPPRSRYARPRAAVLWLLMCWLTLSACASEKSVTLVDGGQAREHTTQARTVGDFLAEQGVSLGPEDRVQPRLEDPLPEERVVVARASQIRVLADGRTIPLLTLERSPDQLLAMAGVELGPHDSLLSGGEPVQPDRSLDPAPVLTLEVRRAVPVSVTDGGETRTFRTAAATLGQAMWENGYRLYAADRVEPGLDTPLAGPVQVSLVRSQPVSVAVDGFVMDFRTTAGTVGQALAQAGLALQDLDYSLPPEGSALPADGRLEVVRVTEQVLLEQEPIPFTSTSELDSNLELDTRAITNPGSYGVRATRTRVRYEAGEEIARQAEGTWQALDPQARVIGFGTQIVTKTLETKYGPLEYWRSVPMYATSYSPCRQGYDFCSTGTASGAVLQKGVAAMLVRHYLAMAGSRVYIPGYGIATILDTGGGIPGRNWIDLGYGEEDYVSWHQWVTVYFLTPVPPEGLILYEFY